MKSPLLIVASCFGVLLSPYVVAQAESPSSAAVEVDVPIMDLCRVIETLPGEKDPLRKSSAFRKVIRGLHKDIRSTAAGKPLDRKRARKHVVSLEKALSKTLASAQKAFHLNAEEQWSRSHQSRAKKFLKGHVFTRSASLRVGEFGFEPSPPLRAALLWSACWAHDTERVIAYGRGATHPDEGAARALAALILVRLDRKSEAQELLGHLGGEGFLVAFAQSKLASDTEQRRRQRALAKRRATTPWQRVALGLPETPEGGVP